MNTRGYVVIRSSFVALHHWPTCPYPDQFFLKHPHRHTFFVEVWIRTQTDRQVEFFEAKRDIDTLLKDFEGKDPVTWSCETFADIIAKGLINLYNIAKVSVFEDQENGAVVEYE